jgi:hypothetical protein
MRVFMHVLVPLVSLSRTCWRSCMRCRAAAVVPLLSPGMPRLAAADPGATKTFIPWWLGGETAWN